MKSVIVFTTGKELTFTNVRSFAMSDTNNAVYIKTGDGKTKAIFNKDNVYGIIDSEYYIDGLYADKAKFSIMFDHGEAIDIIADYYDFNVYTNEITFYAYCNLEDKYDKTSRSIGIFNMNNLIGFEKITREEDKDEPKEA